MKKEVKILTAITLFVLMTAGVQAQIGNVVKRAAKRGAERAVEKKVEKEAEKAVTKAFDDAEKKAEESEKAEKTTAVKTEPAQKTETAVQTPKKKRASTGMTADNAYFPIKQGTTLVYEQQDKNGKATSQSRTSITSVSGTPQNMKVGYEVEVLDKNGKSTNPPTIMTYNINIEDGVIYFDNLGNGITIEGEPFAIPADIKAGDALDDYSVKIMGMKANVTDIKCLAIDNITTKAGTFKAAKIEQTTNAKVFGISSKTKTVTFYVQGVGSVRTETYDKDGKIQQIEELVLFKQ
jgi:hypothetical protein